MRPRAGRLQTRRSGKEPLPQLPHHDIPAPVKGWVVAQSKVANDPATALRLDNFFPMQDTARLRGGSEKFATIGSDPVTALFRYKTSSAEKLFAADASDVYDISNPADPDTPPSADISSQTSGAYAWQQFATSGGEYLYIVNGADKPRLYDGTNWTAIDGVSSPAITGVTTTLLSHVNSYRNRLYFVEGGSMRVWYLPVDSIGGAASSLSLYGVFHGGGSILMTATWSQDAGDGMDDFLVVITDQGEAALFEGDDPGASNWRLVGRYDLSPSLGMNAVMQAGGDLLMAAQDGVIPFSAVIQKDPAALALSAVSRAIEPAWKIEARDRAHLPWQMLKWPDKKMGIVALPADGQLAARAFVVNLETGAWCRYTGLDMRSLSLFGTGCYFGSSDGVIYEMETSAGSDDGANYTGVYVGPFSDFGLGGRHKRVTMARAVYLAARPFNAKLSLTTNYEISIPSAPASAANFSTGDEWDTGEWDSAVWGGSAQQEVTAPWKGAAASGYAIAPVIQITSGTTIAPDVELVAVTLTYEAGAVLV